MGVNGEPLQLHAVYKKPYFFYYMSHKNLYQVLQVTSTASEHAMKLTVDISLTPSYTGNNIPQLLRLACIVTHAGYSEQYRWKQSCDIFGIAL